MKHSSVGELFELSVDEFESRAAIERAEQTLTYGELDIASSNFANYLLDAGATKGATIAILLEDPVEVIKAILGTLKAGCVFVPLEAATPEKRLLSMLSLVEPQWCVVEEKFMLVDGILQHQDGVVSVRAEAVQGMTSAAIDFDSHDFY